MTSISLAMAFAAPALIASLALRWAVEAWRLGAPGIAVGFAAAGVGIAYMIGNAILGA
jgi:hypothetical protein